MHYCLPRLPNIITWAVLRPMPAFVTSIAIVEADTLALFSIAAYLPMPKFTANPALVSSQCVVSLRFLLSSDSSRCRSSASRFLPT